MIRVWNRCLSVAMRRKLPCGTHFGYKARKQSTTQKKDCHASSYACRNRFIIF